MRKMLIIQLLLFIFSQTFAQQLTLEWQSCFGGSKEEILWDIVECSSGYLLVGSSNSIDGDISYNLGGTSGWVVLIDTIGTMIWEKTYGGSKGDGFLRAFPSPDGNFYLIGSTRSFDGDNEHNPYPGTLSWWFLKVDSVGNIIWNKIYGGNSEDQLWHAASTQDGGIVAIGASNSSDGDVSINYGYYDWWIAKLDSDGEIEWEFTVGGTSQDFGQAIIQTSDGGYLAGGALYESGSNGNISCNIFGKADAALVKLDESGNMIWQHCYGGSEHESVLHILEDDDGYVFIAYTGSNNGDVSGNNGQNDSWVVKVDFLGNLIWQKCLGGSRDESPHYIDKLDSGGYVIVGNTYSKDGDVICHPGTIPGAASIWMVHLDVNGEFVWQQCIGGDGWQRVENGVIKRSDFHYVIGGSANQGPTWDVTCTLNFIDNWYDYWVFEARDTTMTGAPELTENTFVKVHPNPAKDYVVFEITSYDHFFSSYQPGFKPRLNIFNSFGQNVATVEVREQHTIWYSADIAPGIYFYHLHYSGAFFAGKLLIVK